MRFKIPKNTEYLVWTNHSIGKMRQYQLSEQRIRRVLNAPKRKEEGIAPNTVAVMQSTGTQKRPTEIWVMYQHLNSKLKGQKSKLRKIRIISAWRYPGISPIRTVPNIPEEVWGILESSDLKQ
jgi:hypothetical protein